MAVVDETPRLVWKTLLENIADVEHPAASEAQERVRKFIVGQLKRANISVSEQCFDANVPVFENAEYLHRAGHKLGKDVVITDKIEQSQAFCNIIAALPGASSETIVLSSHYDTKQIRDGANPGANDSGSSTAFLMGIAARLKKLQADNALKYSYLLIFFDGEEAVLPEWDDGKRIHPFGRDDHTYGSRYFVTRLENKVWKGQHLRLLINFDMIGSAGFVLVKDTYSDKAIFAILAEQSHQLVQDKTIARDPFLNGPRMTVEDDHVPFINAGIRAVNLLDFTHLEHWHKASDTLAHIDYDNFATLEAILFRSLPVIESNLNHL